MRDLPLGARLYLVTLWAIAASLITLMLLGSSMSSGLIFVLILWLAIYVLADFFEVGFELGDGSRASVSIAEAPTIFLVAITGPAGVVVVVLGTFIVDIIRWQRAWYRSLFNASVRVITYGGMLLVYTLIHDPDAAPFSGL